MAKSIYEILVQIEGNEKAKSALNDIGKAAGLTGGALLAFSGAAAKSAAAYETSLAAVSTVATEATGTTAEFDAALNGLATEMEGAISISDAAKASYDILSSGYSNQADVLTILRESQKTAVGGFSDLGTISDATTTIMNSFGDALGATLDTTQRVQLVTNGMIATQNLGKITAGEYASQIGNVASTAAAAGVSLEEVNAAIATSTAAGVNASSSFVGLNQILAVLMKPTAEATELATQLGIEFNAAALQSKGLSGVLADIIDKGGASAENMTKLFGSVEATKVAMTLVASEGAKFNDFLGQMENTAGAVDKAFATMSETTEQKVARALNQLNDSFVKLGQGVLIAIEPAINALALLVDKFTSLPTPIQQTVGAVVLASGAALTLAGAIALVTVSLSTAAGGIAGFVGAIGAAQTAMIGFAAYNGITAASLKMIALQAGLVIAAVGAIALAYDSLREHGTEFNKNSAAMRDGIREVTEELEKQNNELAINDENQLKAIKARREWFDVFGGRQKKRIADIEMNVYEVSDNAGAIADKIRTLGNTQAEVAAKQKLYQLGIQELDSAISKLNEQDLGTEKYNQLRNTLNTSKAVLDNTARAIGLTGQSAATATPQVDGMTKATNQLAEAQAKANAEMAKMQRGGMQMPVVPTTGGSTAVPAQSGVASERVAIATEASTQKLQTQIETAKQNLGTLQTVQATGQAQLKTTETLSANAKAYLQSQVSELQKINTTNTAILASVRFISGQIKGLPTEIAAKLPRPTPSPAPSR